MRAILILFALTFFSIAAAASDASYVKQAMETAPSTANNQTLHKGKVLSSIDASMYTYLEVSEGGKTTWLATMTVAVKKGDMVSYDDGPVMTNFFSKSLNRTFEAVMFVSRVTVIK